MAGPVVALERNAALDRHHGLDLATDLALMPAWGPRRGQGLARDRLALGPILRRDRAGEDATVLGSVEHGLLCDQAEVVLVVAVPRKSSCPRQGCRAADGVLVDRRIRRAIFEPALVGLVVARRRARQVGHQ